jgi:thiosulfate/3-mercaptopyruvate sulfurtransferase
MLDLLIGRRSAAALTTPAPTDDQLAAILRAAASVPDHNKLRPYRFVVVRGEARQRFGAALAASAIEAGADDITIAKASRKPFFGPLLVAIIASPVSHNSVPVWEQVATASLTGYAMVLAAAAVGVGAAWKSGRHLDEAPIVRLLGMGPDEQLLGWINLGSVPLREGKPMQPKDETERPAPRVTELASDPLISVAELAARLGAPDLAVCDVRWYLGAPDRGRTEFAAERIPGARYVDLDTDLADHGVDGRGRHPLPDARTFATRMGELGIGPDTTVVAYDDGSGVPASRLWWMLDALGHRSVRLLDGGIAAWRAAGLALEEGDPVPPVPVDLTLATTWPRTIDREELTERMDGLTLLDVRAGERYRGEVEPVDPKPGHIPGAVSAPSAANMGPDGLLRPTDELAARFASLGADSGDVVVSCGSGVTACHTALAMRRAGLRDPILYAGSYSDWSTAGLPVVMGSEPRSAAGSRGQGLTADDHGG